MLIQNKNLTSALKMGKLHLQNDRFMLKIISLQLKLVQIQLNDKLYKNTNILFIGFSTRFMLFNLQENFNDI